MEKFDDNAFTITKLYNILIKQKNIDIKINIMDNIKSALRLKHVHFKCSFFLHSIFFLLEKSYMHSFIPIFLYINFLSLYRFQSICYEKYWTSFMLKTYAFSLIHLVDTYFVDFMHEIYKIENLYIQGAYIPVKL